MKSEPDEAKKFARFLLMERENRGANFTIEVVPVPQQPNWHDCAIFTIQYVKEILDDPEGFINTAYIPGALETWFPYNKVEKMRSDLASIIIELVTTQRSDPTCRVYQQTIALPEINFNQVKCGLKLICIAYYFTPRASTNTLVLKQSEQEPCERGHC